MKRKSLIALTLTAALAFFASSASVFAQDLESVMPFKVGTFAIDGIPTVGLVVQNDELIVDLAAANRALELIPRYAALTIPGDLIGVISQYEYGLKYRVYEIVNHLVAEDLLNGDMPNYVHPVSSVDIMAPLQYPSKLMNAAVNFYTHACEGCNDDERAAQTLNRQVNRGEIGRASCRERV